VSEAHRNELRSASSGGPSHRVGGPTQSDGGGAAEPISIAWAGAVPGARDQFGVHPTAGDRPAGPHLPAVRRRTGVSARVAQRPLPAAGLLGPGPAGRMRHVRAVCDELTQPSVGVRAASRRQERSRGLGWRAGRGPTGREASSRRGSEDRRTGCRYRSRTLTHRPHRHMARSATGPQVTCKHISGLHVNSPHDSIQSCMKRSFSLTVMGVPPPQSQ